MSLDTLFDQIRYEKLFVSNLYQGTDGQWRCWLRKRRNDIGKMFGMGQTPAEALRNAIDWKPEVADAPPSSIEDQFADLLG